MLRRLSALLFACASMLNIAGCADRAAARAPNQVAADDSASPLEVRGARVVSPVVDLRRPIFVRHDGEVIHVTFAASHVEGTTVRLDAATLEVLGEDPFEYSARFRATPEGATWLTLDGDRQVGIFTADETNRVFVRTGEWPAVPVSPEGTVVVGHPRVSTDGKHLAVAYVRASEGGFSLVVALVG